MSAPATTTPVVSKPSINSILTWKKPQKTAKVFASLLTVLLAFKFVNLINLFFKVSFISLFTASAAEYVGKLVTGQGFASRFQPGSKYQTKLSQYSTTYVPRLAPYVAQFEKQVNSIIFAHDIEKTLKAAVLSYVLYKITSWFSLYTLLVSSVVLAFTVPVTYKTYEKEIHEAGDKYSSLAKSKAVEYKDLAYEHTKPYIAQVQTKVSPYTSKLSGYLPKNRTAGSTVGASPVPAATASSTGTTTGVEIPKMPEVPNLHPVNAAAAEAAAGVKSSIQKEKATHAL